jgi:hypothetical protein
MKALLLTLTLSAALAFGADEQLTVQKVTIMTPSGTITGKVVGTGEKLVFVDDRDPVNSFTLTRGEVRQFKTTDGGDIVVELARPVADQAGTTSNVRITVIDPASSATLTRWFEMPVERSRTITTYSTDVRHDHRDGEGHCNGKLMANDTTLRFESVSEAGHSRSWNYNDLRSFEKEPDHSLLKVTAKNGENFHFKTVNGKTAGALYDVVAQKMVDARR